MKSLEFIEELVTHLEDFKEGVKETWKSDTGQTGKMASIIIALSEFHIRTSRHINKLIKEDMKKSN